MAGGVFDVVAQLGVDLATRAQQSEPRSGIMAELATREGRERFMDEAAARRGSADLGADPRSTALKEAMSFHGRHDLFNAAMRSASREGRTFEAFGDGELQHYNALEAGRAKPALIRPSAEREAVLEQIATRDGRAAFMALDPSRRSGVSAEVHRDLLDPGKRSERLLESEGAASRAGRPFEPLGMLEKIGRQGPESLPEIDTAPARSRGEIGAMLSRIDSDLSRSPVASAQDRSRQGWER